MPTDFLSGLTDQQKAMQTARNPLNNNEQNKVDLSFGPSKNKTLSTQEYAKQSQAQMGVGARASQQRTAGGGLSSSPVQSMLSNLGSFGLSVQAATNQFLNGSGVSDVNVSLGQGGDVQLKDGMWTPSPLATTVNANVDALTQQKLQEQQNLKNVMMQGGVFNEQGTAASFDKILAKFADQNGDGVISPEEQQWLNKAFDAANAVRRMKESEPGSPQYEALMMQLQQMDKDGIVSGVVQALDEYDKITGADKKGYGIVGADNQEYNLSDIVNMNAEGIRSQLQQATTGSLGLFGGDFSANLKRQVDESALKYRKSSEQEAAVANTLVDVGSDWISRYKGEFEKYRGDINAQFTQGAQDVVADIDKQATAIDADSTITAEEKTKQKASLQKAKQWITDMAKGSGNKDFATTIYNFLTGEEGVAPEAQRIIKNYLGTKLDTTEVGPNRLGNLLRKIGETGKVQKLDSAGNVTQIPITGRDRLTIASIMNDDRLNDQQKSQYVEGIISNASAEFGGGLKTSSDTLKGMFEQVADGKGNTIGRLEEAIDAFGVSLGNSVKTFHESLAEEVYTKAKDAGVTGRQGLLASSQQQAAQIKQQIIEAREQAVRAAEAAKAQATKDVETLTKQIEATKAAVTTASTNAQAEALKVYEAAKADALQRLQPYLANETAGGYTYNDMQIQALVNGKAGAAILQANNAVKDYETQAAIKALSGNVSGISRTEIVGTAKLVAAKARQYLNSIPQEVQGNTETQKYIEALNASIATANKAISDADINKAKAISMADTGTKEIDAAILDPQTVLQYASRYGNIANYAARHGIVDQEGRVVNEPVYHADVQTFGGKRQGDIGVDIGKLTQRPENITAVQTQYTPAAMPVKGEENMARYQPISAGTTTEMQYDRYVPPTVQAPIEEPQVSEHEGGREVRNPDRSRIVTQRGPGGEEYIKEVYDAEGNQVYKHQGYGGIPASSEDLRTTSQKVMEWLKGIGGSIGIGEGTTQQQVARELEELAGRQTALSPIEQQALRNQGNQPTDWESVPSDVSPEQVEWEVNPQTGAWEATPESIAEARAENRRNRDVAGEGERGGEESGGEDEGRTSIDRNEGGR